MMKQDLIYNKYHHANRYVTNILNMFENKLPKSTTCCWQLSKDYQDKTMHQYFVATKYKFALDISSNVLKNDNAIGATFMSSMFYHATSIPVWIDLDNRVFLSGPKDMYNFAWGSNGTNKEK